MENEQRLTTPTASTSTTAPKAITASPWRMQVLMMGMQKNLLKKADELAKELVQNFPEYGSEEWIQCTGYDYDKGLFTFQVEDPENEGQHETLQVTTADLAAGIPMFWLAVQAKECCPYAICCEGSDFWDAGNWDQPAVDCLLQYHFYGECVFG